jgi:hypothetical protein
LLSFFLLMLFSFGYLLLSQIYLLLWKHQLLLLKVFLLSPLLLLLDFYSSLQGLSFYGFFAMMVANLGGPNTMLKLMRSHNRTPCCCCPNDPLRFYNRVRGALFQFLVLRPVVLILAAYCAYQDQQALTLILTAVGLVMLAYGFISLVLFCESPSGCPDTSSF